MLCVTVFTCGYGGIIIGLIGLIEGIIYLTKSDQEFLNTYVINKKEWFKHGMQVMRRTNW